MYQTCQHCSYESPIGARFCRQCGVQLYVETEASAAGTRNYGRQEPAVTTSGSGHLPPSVADVVAGETERYYQAPYVPAAVIPPTAPIKPGKRPWRWIMLLLVLLIGAAIGVMVTEGLHQEWESRTPEEVAHAQRAEDARRRQEDARRRQEDLMRQAEDRMRQAQDRAQQAQDRAREALDRASEAAEQASEAGAAIEATDEKPLDLSQYEYPGATVGNSIRIPGREMLTMRVSEGHFDAVNQFYQKKLGEPIIEINDPPEKRLIFQSSTTPLISVSVEIDFNRPGQLMKIVVLRSPLRIPRPDQAQNPK